MKRYWSAHLYEDGPPMNPGGGPRYVEVVLASDAEAALAEAQGKVEAARRELQNLVSHVDELRSYLRTTCIDGVAAWDWYFEQTRPVDTAMVQAIKHLTT